MSIYSPLGNNRQQQVQEQQVAREQAEADERAEQEDRIAQDQELIEATRGDDRKAFNAIDLVSNNVNPSLPTVMLTPNEISKQVALQKQFREYTEEQLKYAIKMQSLELQNLFSKDIVLAFITEDEKKKITLALEAADESLVFNKRLPVEIMLTNFKSFLKVAQITIVVSRGFEGFSMKMATTQTNIIKRDDTFSSRGKEKKEGFFDRLTGFMSGAAAAGNGSSWSA